MARPASKSRHSNAKASTPPETVSGRWLLKAFGAVVLLALVCSYFSLWLLYSLGQWQIVLHPDPKAKLQPAPAGLIRFGPDESGQPQLTGEWIAAAPGSRYSSMTVLFLGGGDGSRQNSAATVAALNGLGLNVFWFDYRGYGLSANVHPSQQRMTEDSEAAWRYLTGSRGIAARQIVLYGTGVGASLAAGLAAGHPEMAGVILDAPFADLLEVARKDSRSGLVPARLLFHERFPLAAPLATLATPKLLISAGNASEPSAYARAATPKMTVSLPAPGGPLYDQAVTRFLDQYVAQPAPMSSTAPAGTKTH